MTGRAGRAGRAGWAAGRGWPRAVAGASGWWAGPYAAVQLGWAATGTTVPWTAHRAHPAAAFPLLAALAVLAAAATRAGSGSRWGRAVLWAAIPVYAAGGVGLPLHFVQLATLSGLESATGLTQVVLDAAGAALLALTALAHRRHRTGRCPRCGHRHPGPADGPLRHPAPAPPTRRTRAAAYLLLLGLLPWAGVKTVWTLGGDALGVTAAAWAAAASDGASGTARALARLGIDLTVLAAAVGVLLLLGLLHRWGQTFPRPIPLLGGRRVPRLLPLVPAWLTGAPLAGYGLVLTAAAPPARPRRPPAPGPRPALHRRRRPDLDDRLRRPGLHRTGPRPPGRRPLLRGPHPAALRGPDGADGRGVTGPPSGGRPDGSRTTNSPWQQPGCRFAGGAHPRCATRRAGAGGTGGGTAGGPRTGAGGRRRRQGRGSGRTGACRDRGSAVRQRSGPGRPGAGVRGGRPPPGAVRCGAGQAYWPGT